MSGRRARVSGLEGGLCADGGLLGGATAARALRWWLGQALLRTAREAVVAYVAPLLFARINSLRVSASERRATRA